MNFVPFKLQTKRKEKKEVINLNKMEEEERKLIKLINSTGRKCVFCRVGEGNKAPQAAGASSHQTLGAGGFGRGVSVDPLATHWLWTPD